MKKILILNGLILSTLSISAQNLINQSFDNNMYASNVQVNYNTNWSNVSTQQTISNTNLQVVQVQTQTQVNKPKKQTKVIPKSTQLNMNDNVSNLNNPNADVNIGDVRDNNVNINSNPGVNTTQKTTNTVVVVEEFKGTEFKPIGLSGRDYSNGGKMKKGVKNFPKADHSKVKHKKKPAYKKVKYHTSKCANW